MSATPASPYQGIVDNIEIAYEHLLAYAAQGSDGSGESGAEVRASLVALVTALEALPAVLDGGSVAIEARELLRQDAAKAAVLVRVAVSARSVSSRVADSLVASHHLRSLLTTLYLLEAVGDPAS